MTSMLRRLAVLTTLAVGCNPPADDAAGKDPKAGPGKDDAADPAPSPLGLPPMAQFFTAGLDEPGPYEELRQSPGHEDGAPHHLVLELDGTIAELQSFDLLGGMGGTPLRTLTEALHAAAADESVKGLVIRAAELSLDMATAEELRGHLLAFKGDGARPVRCHTEGPATRSTTCSPRATSWSSRRSASCRSPGPRPRPCT